MVTSKTLLTSVLKNFEIISTWLKKTYEQWEKSFAPSPCVLRSKIFENKDEITTGT